MKKLAVAMAIAACLSGLGCSGGVCPTVVRTAASTQTKVSDGMRALDQARAVAQNVPMPPDKLAKLNAEIQRGVEALTEVNKVLSAAIIACNEPNVDDKFAAFNTAWTAIKVILSLFAENAGYSKYVGPGDVGLGVKAAPVTVSIKDPFFYEE